MNEIICNCGGTCKFQGDIGEMDEYKCQSCGQVYSLPQGGIASE